MGLGLDSRGSEAATGSTSETSSVAPFWTLTQRNLNFREEASHLLPDRRITFARCCLEFGAVNNRHKAPAIMNQSGHLKLLSNQSNGRTADSEHCCKKLMRQFEFVLPGSIMRHEQPPA